MGAVERYEVAVEMKVVVTARALSGEGKVVGEYTVRDCAYGANDNGDHLPGLTEGATARVSKHAKAMMAGVVNTERNRKRT